MIEWFTGCGMWDTGYGTRDTGHGIRDTGHRTRDMGLDLGQWRVTKGLSKC